MNPFGPGSPNPLQVLRFPDDTMKKRSKRSTRNQTAQKNGGKELAAATKNNHSQKLLAIEFVYSKITQK